MYGAMNAGARADDRNEGEDEFVGMDMDAERDDALETEGSAGVLPWRPSPNLMDYESDRANDDTNRTDQAMGVGSGLGRRILSSTSLVDMLKIEPICEKNELHDDIDKYDLTETVQIDDDLSEVTVDGDESEGRPLVVPSRSSTFLPLLKPVAPDPRARADGGIGESSHSKDSSTFCLRSIATADSITHVSSAPDYDYDYSYDSMTSDENDSPRAAASVGTKVDSDEAARRVAPPGEPRPERSAEARDGAVVRASPIPGTKTQHKEGGPRSKTAPPVGDACTNSSRDPDASNRQHRIESRASLETSCFGARESAASANLPAHRTVVPSMRDESDGDDRAKKGVCRVARTIIVAVALIAILAAVVLGSFHRKCIPFNNHRRLWDHFRQRTRSTLTEASPVKINDTNAKPQSEKVGGSWTSSWTVSLWKTPHPLQPPCVWGHRNYHSQLYRPWGVPMQQESPSAARLSSRSFDSSEPRAQLRLESETLSSREEIHSRLSELIVAMSTGESG